MHLIARFCGRIGRFTIALALAAGVPRLNADAVRPTQIENEYVKYVIEANGSNSAFVDKMSGTDYCAGNGAAGLARLRKGGKQYEVSQAVYTDGKLQVQFGES